ncbi:hypothetical protein A2715_04050 [Candidatus Woesebacteria bacterium RIFCSPHIGHO2_01_FULL_39_32]|uniref:Thioredoxin domain-containing protein n=1 Tax=Candidatus Woesebacteria bacterium RIFCSPLOWO2_01_FULL_39_25 TaxID=1802521 RepID=A0A1F8BN16_9BACT|nr:MAG: hypothetical protein A2124_04205 [Candidatus Woesebacteria bacterium GWB1_37_5]OGM25193.1 MAG: hypothetical protein A2715_04050 [Candidatus Woesebacteria bacterium RIFCSPHIGHO2_01_FULL_39_32]OGM37694.1 MAG: hypothetical protein A3F01_01250 [Candidatus Woesebacteria bacterium RIFCSPHIGHO2_12_FULL_38_11]OGM64725.1 MAG: hypothetical protein A2893_03660 [Candidatus Woesebacteria bacterium RIFCSPLOWO2_01_FULL_39_25]
MRERGNALLIVLVIAGILALVGLLLLKGRSSQDASNQKQDLMAPKGKDSAVEDGSSTLMGDRYIEYSPEVLASNKDKKRVLYFYANWCPTCRPADADFKANESQIPEDVVLIRVNYNDSDTDSEEEQLATQYGITYQHTFVQIDESGNEVTKWNGGQIEELLERL